MTDTETGGEFGATPTAAGEANQTSASPEPIVQYIVVRTDLGWGTGALIAQACHASVASIARTITSNVTTNYLRDLESMHKIILRADKEDDLTTIVAKLKEANVAHHLWIEQPENIASCLACSPQPKSLVQAIFKRFKLFK